MASFDKDTSTLDLSCQELHTLPEEVLRLVNLEVLILSGNHLSFLPEEISQLTKLRHLDVSDNKLECLPTSLRLLEHLQELNANNNELSYLPEGVEDCKTLEELHLSCNKFTGVVPEVLFSLPSLKRLYVAENGFEEVPPAISNASALQILYLGANKLRSLPAEIAQLHRLEVLYLGVNELDVLPAGLGGLSSLKSLDLHNNKFVALPLELLCLDSLQELSLRGNPLLTRFVSEGMDEVPSLKELAARTIVHKKLEFHRVLPEDAIEFLQSGRHCSNPECDSLYFEHGVRTVQFVDMCGKYRVPLWNYLCSSHYPHEDQHADANAIKDKLRRVILDAYSKKSV
eukprot:Colp12_sorted_trinity150504_noHs@22855